MKIDINSNKDNAKSNKDKDLFIIDYIYLLY